MFELLPWQEFPDSDDSVRRIRLLAIDGNCAINDALVELRRKHPHDYKKLLASTRFALTRQNAVDDSHVRASAKYEVYEIKGGQIRLFYFVTQSGELIVCTNTYWKAKSSRNEQNAAFEKCARLRNEYSRWTGGRHT